MISTGLCKTLQFSYSEPALPSGRLGSESPNAFKVIKTKILIPTFRDRMTMVVLQSPFSESFSAL
jgi:hypothetical protein